jgi:broad-specificity NMP kinase
LSPLSSQEAIKAKLGTISQAAQSKLEEDTAKKEAKAEAKADAARKKKLVRSHQNLIQSHLADYFPRRLK